MFPVKLFVTYVLLIIHTITISDCLKVVNENEENNFNLKLSAAVDFIKESVSLNTIRVIGCNRYFTNDFNKLSERLRTNHSVSFTLLNMEKKYGTKMKFPKNDFILMLVDEHFGRYLPAFMEMVMGRLRKHKMLIIFKTRDCDTNGSINELSSFLWSKKVLNFIILRDCGNLTGPVFSYFPFANGKCREFIETNVIKLGTFHFNTSDLISFHPEQIVYANEIDTSTRNYLPFFPNKVPMKLNNCEIIVSTGIWPPAVVDVNRGRNERGVEMDFVFTALEHMNAAITVVVDPNSWHGLTQDENEEHSGRLALLKNETFDLMTGSIPTHYNIFRDFDATESYLPNAIAFVVPTAAVFPSSLILWSMLEKQTKFLLLIVGVVLILSIIVNVLIQMTWKMRLVAQPKASFLKNILTTFLVFLRSLIETSTPTMPDNRTIQWIYGMWFACGLIISCYFNTTLTSFFTEPGRLKQLETIPDIMESNIQVAMNDLYYPIMTADPVLEKYFISRNMNCSVLVGLKLTAMGVGVTFTDKMRAEHIAAQWVSSSGEKSIQFIATGNLKYWSNVVLHRGNVFTGRINDLVQRINQSGYWEHQIRRYYYSRLIRIMIRQYLMVNNYRQGISNDRLINELNKEFLDTSDSLSKETADQSEKIILETSEQEIIERFVRTDKTLITWETLSPVFRVWAIGMATAGIVFLFERFIHYCM